MRDAKSITDAATRGAGTTCLHLLIKKYGVLTIYPSMSLIYNATLKIPHIVYVGDKMLALQDRAIGLLLDIAPTSPRLLNACVDGAHPGSGRACA